MDEIEIAILCVLIIGTIVAIPVVYMKYHSELAALVLLVPAGYVVILLVRDLCCKIRKDRRRKWSPSVPPEMDIEMNLSGGEEVWDPTTHRHKEIKNELQ
jgi:hypothetical protein